MASLQVVPESRYDLQEQRIAELETELSYLAYDRRPTGETNLEHLSDERQVKVIELLKGGEAV